MNRTKTWLLAVGLLSVLSCPAWAQGTSFQGYSQEDVYFPRPELTDDWFSQPDLSTYGRGPRPPEGPYFTMDYLRVAIEAPEAAFIGFPPPFGGTDFATDLDTTPFDAKWQDGSRFEVGNRVGKYGNRGWMASGFALNQNQDIYGAQFTNVLIPDFFDPLFLRNSYRALEVRNETKVYGLDINRSWRPIPADTPFAMVCEWFVGLRYAYFADDYRITGDSWDIPVFEDQGDPPVPTLVELIENGMDDYWRTKSENNLFGPQIGVRISKQNGPWTFAFDGRAFAAWNWKSIEQSYHLERVIAAPGITTLDVRTGNQEVHDDTFAPAGEIRFDVSYLLTRRVKARIGYSGYYFTELARAPSMVDYFPGGTDAIGINMLEKSQSAWAQGIHIGVEVNH